jgi:hypothetical protein
MQCKCKRKQRNERKYDKTMHVNPSRGKKVVNLELHEESKKHREM